MLVVVPLPLQRSSRLFLPCPHLQLDMAKLALQAEGHELELLAAVEGEGEEEEGEDGEGSVGGGQAEGSAVLELSPREGMHAAVCCTTLDCCSVLPPCGVLPCAGGISCLCHPAPPCPAPRQGQGCCER